MDGKPIIGLVKGPRAASVCAVTHTAKRGCSGEAAATIETWRQHYNAVRPHSNFGYLTPNEFRAKQVKTTQSREAVL